MRFNKRITFVTESAGGYNPITGEYDEKTLTKVTKPCNISSMKIDRKKELFGEIDKAVTVVRLQQPYTKTFDYIEINGQKMNILHRSDYRKGVLYLEGDILAQN